MPHRPADRPLTARRAATRDRLVEAAAAVFAEQGFGATAVEDVCARAGFTRGAFYSNFASLTEVFVELYRRRADQLTAAVQAAAAEVGEVTSANVGTLVARVVGRLPDDARWRILQAEFTAHALRDPSAAAALDAPRVALAGVVRPMLGPGASARAASDLARVLVAVHDGLSVQAQLDPGARLATLRRRALQATAEAALAGALGAG